MGPEKRKGMSASLFTVATLSLGRTSRTEYTQHALDSQTVENCHAR
jgi:hypothetical protein